MKKVLGTASQYYTQMNNGQVELFKDYFRQPKMIACGPTAAVMCTDIAGWPMTVFTPGEQPEDSVLMVMENPQNLKLFQDRRPLDYDKIPVNEVPQCYEVAFELIYKRTDVCKFTFGLDFTIIKASIDAGNPLMICGSFPAGGHYVSVVGYEDEPLKQVVIFNDPYPVQWPDNKGYNREMTLSFLETQIQKFRVEFLKYTCCP